MKNTEKEWIFMSQKSNTNSNRTRKTKQQLNYFILQLNYT